MESRADADEEALLGVCFAHPSWLGGPLGQHNILDYFSASDFYDKSCNNELLRMQERDMSLLRAMKGLEYEIRFADEAQGIFVICKQIRDSPDLAHPQTYYYIMHGTVYQCPTIQHVLTARMTTCSYHLEEAFRMVHSAVRFDPSAEPSYTYDFAAPMSVASSDGADPEEELLHEDGDTMTPAERTQEEHYRNQQTADRSSRILNSIIGQFPLPGEAPRVPLPATAGVSGATRAQAGDRSGANTKKRRLIDL